MLCLLCAESWTGCLGLCRCLDIDLGEAKNLVKSREKGTRAAATGEGDDNRLGLYKTC